MRASTLCTDTLFIPLQADRTPGCDAGRDPGEKCGLIPLGRKHVEHYRNHDHHAVRRFRVRLRDLFRVAPVVPRLALIIGIVLHRTNVGNWIYATGGHTEAAKDLGINWRRVKIGCFMLCSILAGFGGILQTFRVGGSVMPTYGLGLELEAIAAAVIGGTSLFGGVGSVLGALVGVVLVRSIDNGFIIARIDIEFFRLALGGLTIAAVMFNTDLQRLASGLKVSERDRGG